MPKRRHCFHEVFCLAQKHAYNMPAYVPPDAKLKKAVRAAPCYSMPVQRMKEHANAKNDGTDDFRIAQTTISNFTDVLAQPRNAV